MKARPTNSTLGGMAVLATILTILFGWGVASSADFHQPGMDCTDCHDVSGASTNISAIALTIDSNSVVFLASPGDYARFDNDGVCEACHYDTKATHIDDMELELVYPDSDDCTTCHGTHCADTPSPGDPGMFSTGAIPDDAGHDLHYLAPDAKMAVALDCPDCHLKVGEEITYTLFKDGEPLLTTNACDGCHGGPGGAFPGVDELNNAVIGAKANWTDGIYMPDGVTLKADKGEWCATCHDDVPASSRPGPAGGASHDVIVDDPDATFVPDCIPGSCDPFSEWNYAANGLSYGTGDRYMAIKSLTPGGAVDGTATWTPTIPETGEYNVYAWWNDKSGDAKRSSSVTYTIYYNDGFDSVPVTADQTENGGQWNLLDTRNFNAGTSCYVELSNDAPQGTDPTKTWVRADAIKFVWATTSIDAPNVIGNNTDDGYYKTGHGAANEVSEVVGCVDCHDASKNHIDHKHRTYVANVTDYGDSYRLRDIDGKPAMNLPRPERTDIYAHLDDYALCLDCHNADEVLGKSEADKKHTNFTATGVGNLHAMHLRAGSVFDSDWNGVEDSYESCITCHNVHGPPNPAMIRHGELIDNKSLDFCYMSSVTWPRVCDPVATLEDSEGSLIAPGGSSFATNGFCAMGCHTNPVGPGSEDLLREPYLGPKVIDAKAAPETVAPGADVLLTAFVLDHNDNVNSVTVNLSPIDGIEETMNDDGIDGDVADNDGIYSCIATVSVTPPSGQHDLVVTAKDADDSFVGAKGTIELSVTSSLLLVDDPDATFSPDCAPGSCDPYSEWRYAAAGGDRYGTGDRYMAVKSLTPGGAVDGTATWTPTIPATGEYDVYAWWDDTSGDAKRSSSVTYTIYYNDGFDSVPVTADQTANGGRWNLLDTRNFNAGTSCYVELSNDAPKGTDPTKTWVRADAIKFEPSTSDVIVDDPDATVSPDCIPGSCDRYSEWEYAAGGDRYGTGDRYMAVKSLTPGGAVDGTATWTPTIPETGEYNVYAWWDDKSGDAKRSSSVTYTIYYNDGFDSVQVTADQTADGGQWNLLLDTRNFNAGTSCYVELSNDAPKGTDPTKTWVRADAIWWQPVP